MPQSTRLSKLVDKSTLTCFYLKHSGMNKRILHRKLVEKYKHSNQGHMSEGK